MFPQFRIGCEAMETEIKHAPFASEPTNQSDVDRLEAMFKSVQETYDHFSNAIWGIQAITDFPTPKIERHDGLTILTCDGAGRFTGLAVCPHCMERAAMYCRDLANIFDDICKETPKFKTRDIK